MKKTFFFYLILAALLSGCTINEEGAQIASIDEDNRCEESGGLFCDDDASVSDLELIVENANPLISPAASGDCDGNIPRDSNGDKQPPSEESIYCFDFSGSCNESGLDSAHVVGRLSFESYDTTYTLGSCKRGKFHVQLRLELQGSQLCTLHTIELELIGKKADGTEVTQPARAKKRTGFQVFNHVDCQ